MINTAIFIDLENTNKQIDYSKLIEGFKRDISKQVGEEVNIVVRRAVGNEGALKNVTQKLTQLNFDIILSVKNGNKKNKSDLIISTDAMECLLVDRPVIDCFVFVTSDSAYSVVASKLKKYGKKVCFIVKEEDLQKEIFTSVSDCVYNVKDYYTVDDEATYVIDLKKTYSLKKEEDVLAFITMLKVLFERSKNKYFKQKNIKDLFRKQKPSINLNSTSFKSYKNLFDILLKHEIIKYKETDQNEIKVIGHKKIKEILEGDKNVK